MRTKTSQFLHKMFEIIKANVTELGGGWGEGHWVQIKGTDNRKTWIPPGLSDLGLQ